MSPAVAAPDMQKTPRKLDRSLAPSGFCRSGHEDHSSPDHAGCPTPSGCSSHHAGEPALGPNPAPRPRPLGGSLRGRGPSGVGRPPQGRRPVAFRRLGSLSRQIDRRSDRPCDRGRPRPHRPGFPVAVPEGATVPNSPGSHPSSDAKVGTPATLGQAETLLAFRVLRRVFAWAPLPGASARRRPERVTGRRYSPPHGDG